MSGHTLRAPAGEIDLDTTGDMQEMLQADPSDDSSNHIKLTSAEHAANTIQPGPWNLTSQTSPSASGGRLRSGFAMNSHVSVSATEGNFGQPGIDTSGDGHVTLQPDCTVDFPYTATKQPLPARGPHMPQPLRARVVSRATPSSTFTPGTLGYQTNALQWGLADCVEDDLCGAKRKQPYLGSHSYLHAGSGEMAVHSGSDRDPIADESARKSLDSQKAWRRQCADEEGEEEREEGLDGHKGSASGTEEAASGSRSRRQGSSVAAVYARSASRDCGGWVWG